jgi:DNA-binding NarL/FixJ family response regulator
MDKTSPLDTPLRVLIADDHPIVREGLMRTIERDESFIVVGQAGNGADALRLIAELHPEIAVLDISMPVMDGIEVARRVHRQGFLTDLILLTMHMEPEYLEVALDLGVCGYLLKESMTTDLLNCLKAVAAGQHYISPTMAHLLVEWKKKGAAAQDLPLSERLTPAELSVLRLLSENRSNKEIAEGLFISVRTVENHRARICDKLSLTGHNKLLQFALENREKI